MSPRPSSRDLIPARARASGPTRNNRTPHAAVAAPGSARSTEVRANPVVGSVIRRPLTYSWTLTKVTGPAPPGVPRPAGL
ncbi:hypothetical protein DN402_05870 [Streptomyces sp. SW4]|nr:hypothetical protein DN402_05870 [Streptomyces sp. SW4]